MIKAAFILFASIAIIQEASAYPTGAPSSACGTMTPRHGDHLPKVSASPVNIVLSKTNVQPGETITVRLESIDPNFQFKGFMIQSRAVGSNDLVGTMTPVDKHSKVVDCSGPTTATHADRDLKNSVTLEWTAPGAADNVQMQ